MSANSSSPSSSIICSKTSDRIARRSEENIVNSQPQSELETWRAIVFSFDGTKALFKLSEGGLAFPSVEIPCGERLAENLTAALGKRWGCEAVCLFTLNGPSQDGGTNDPYEVM